MSMYSGLKEKDETQDDVDVLHEVWNRRGRLTTER